MRAVGWLLVSAAFFVARGVNYEHLTGFGRWALGFIAVNALLIGVVYAVRER